MSTDPALYRPRFTVKVEDFRRWRSNTLRGFCTVRIQEVRLRIIDLTVHQSHGRRWVSLPAKPQIDKDGVARRDDFGKIQYTTVIQFVGRDVADAFSNRVLEELLEVHPDAFSDPEAPQ